MSHNTSQLQDKLTCFVKVKATSNIVHPDDVSVEGYYAIEVRFREPIDVNVISIEEQAGIATDVLDEFHEKIGIAVLDDFEISVFTENGQEIVDGQFEFGPDLVSGVDYLGPIGDKELPLGFFKKKYFKTLVTFEILSTDRPWYGDLSSISSDLLNGDLSGRQIDFKVSNLDKNEMRDVLIEQGSDPSFFLAEEEDSGDGSLVENDPRKFIEDLGYEVRPDADQSGMWVWTRFTEGCDISYPTDHQAFDAAWMDAAGQAIQYLGCSKSDWTQLDMDEMHVAISVALTGEAPQFESLSLDTQMEWVIKVRETYGDIHPKESFRIAKEEYQDKDGFLPKVNTFESPKG